MSSRPLTPPPPSTPTIPDPSSQSLGHHSPNTLSWSLDCHSSYLLWGGLYHLPLSSWGPNLHPGGDSPPPVVRSHPSGFLQQQALDPNLNLNAVPLDTHSSFPLYLDDMNPMARPSSMLLNPNSLLVNPQGIMPSHPSPLVPTRAAHPAPSLPPICAPSLEVNPISYNPFMPLLPPSTSPINLGEPIDTWSRRYVTYPLARADPSQARLAVSGRLPCKPTHAGKEALLRNNPRIIHFRPVLQSRAPSLTSRPANSAPVQKRQRMSTISETPSRVNGNVDAAQTSHPGLQVCNPSPLIAQPIPTSGNIQAASPHTIPKTSISKPTAVDLFNLAKALGGKRLADLVCKAYASYISPEDAKEGCGETSEQSVSSKFEPK